MDKEIMINALINGKIELEETYASFGVEWQYLIGAGFTETIDFLERSNDPQSIEIISYLSERNTKNIDGNESYEEWLDFRYKYF